MKAFIFSLVVFFGVVSCKNHSKTDILIPREKFRDILIDIHLADASYSMNYYKYNFHSDTLNFYNDVLRQYGYTRANFDSTIKYYTKQQKEFGDIYDEVITELNKMQHEIYMLQRYETDPNQNLYKGKKQWSFPKDSAAKIAFEIPLKKKDTVEYTVIAQLARFYDDESKNPRLTAYFWYNDGTKKGYREYFPEAPYKKSQRLITYFTSLKPKSRKVTHIKGCILDSDKRILKYTRHIDIKNIIVSRNF